MVKFRHFAVIYLCLPGTLCNYLTPTYPQPLDLSSNQSLVAQSWNDLTSLLDDSIKHPEKAKPAALAGAKNVTFSLGMFSLHDPAASKLQYHHAGAETTNSRIGTRVLDENSIYRIASVSKLITAYTGMVALSEEDWNRPLSDIIPALRNYEQSNALGSGPAYTTSWDTITLAALASQVGGVGTLLWPAGDLAVSGISQGPKGLSAMLESGLPPFNISILGPCATRPAADPKDVYCSGPDAMQAVAGIPPNFLPWTSPAYSDGGFMLIGMAISNITGKPLSELYKTFVFTPLGMLSTSVTPPTDTVTLNRSVVSEETLAEFSVDGGFTAPSGGMFSTLHDLSKLGVGILNNTLLAAETTRRWMKPQTHTSSLSYSIGRGWEIHRFLHPKTGRVTDLYTKLGDSGAQGSVLVLIPEYDAGFTLLNTYSNNTIRSEAILAVLDHVTNSIVPALEAQAQAEAKGNYVGKYTSSYGQVNASVTIALNQSTFPGITSGLTLIEWSFNGTDVLASLIGGKPQLEVTIPKQTPDGSPGQVAFQLSQYPQAPTYSSAMGVRDSPVIGTWTGFYRTNGDFAFTDQIRYAGIGLNLFVFDVNGEGKATAVSPAVQRVTLQKTKDFS